MGLIRSRRRKGRGGFPQFGALVFFLFAAAGPGAAHTQNLGAEIQGIEKSLENPGLSDAGRRSALTRLARLWELLGDLEAAARLWGEAAAGPGGPDDLSLIRGAWCLAAMGEWDQARAAVTTVLLAGRPGPALFKARYLAALVEALGAGQYSALSALAENPSFADLKPALYYTLWKSQSPSVEGESWKTRLLSEFPRSPEGLIAAAEAAGSGKTGPGNIRAAPTPLWLLLPGRQSLSAPGDSPPAAAGPARPAPAAPASAETAPAAPAPGGSSLLQTGLFSNRENAQKQADQLRAAGFSPLVVRRQVKGAEYWAVGVSPGQNMSQLTGRLKNAGFESFPIQLE